jgi:SAM-dependent methyltransferase
MSLYRNQLENWLKRINVKAERVLDIGGASNPARNRVASYEVEETVFFDNGAEEAKVQYIPFDLNLPITQLEGYEKEIKRERKNLLQFDAVFCLEVFEYIWNPVQAMKNIYDLMTEDSVCYISFPAIYPVHQPYEIDYLRYTKQAIMKYLELSGFTQIQITERVATNGRGALAEFYSLEGMHPLRKSDLPYDIGYLVKARKLTI